MKGIILVVGAKGKKLRRYHSQNYEVIYYDHRTKSKVSNVKLEILVKKADVIYVMINSCSHQSMHLVKRLSKRYNKLVFYIKRTRIYTI